MKLYLGSGPNIKEGYINCDARTFPGVDKVFYVGKDPFPFQDDTVDEILAENFCEHLGWNDTEDYMVNMINECFRILKPFGKLKIAVPHFPGGPSLMHPEHRRFFIRDSFSFYQVPADGIDPHGYLNGFWHVQIDEKRTDDLMLYVIMTPNKPGNEFPYKEIRARNEIKEKGIFDEVSNR